MIPSQAKREQIKATIAGEVIRESADELVYRCLVSDEVDTWRRMSSTGPARGSDLMERVGVERKTTRSA